MTMNATTPLLRPPKRLKPEFDQQSVTEERPVKHQIVTENVYIN